MRFFQPSVLIANGTMTFERPHGHTWQWRYDEAVLAHAESVIGRKAVVLLQELFSIKEIREVRILPRELRLTAYMATIDWAPIEEEVEAALRDIYERGKRAEDESPIGVSFAVSRAHAAKIYGGSLALAANLL
jgi:hypothetical protein